MFTAVQHSACTRPFARLKGPILLAFESLAWSWPATVGFICLYPTPNNNATVMTTTATMEWQVRDFSYSFRFPSFTRKRDNTRNVDTSTCTTVKTS
ncbi:hypothetical protein F5148DRAFT_477468 [Russula earlei]|uniref:Uncharacterized protein n=1 Tax=Russula earlei TaxID=71964 RepID=A0ACC0TYR3_9AGAM|nr:hypothetical protein F5148DRAFT_477468 [Russula earlei]